MAEGTAVGHDHPAITWWVSNHGWIEVGYDDSNRSFVRALDPGGMVWEGEYRYASLDDALAALETALAAFIREQFKITLTERKDDAEGTGEQRARGAHRDGDHR
jgi:hypothetical protein